MTFDPLTELDNPAWHALTGHQRAFATGSAAIRRYRPGILPFAACESGRTENIDALDTLLSPVKSST